MLDADLLGLLRVALRSQATTVKELAYLAVRPEDEVRAAVRSLAGRGHLVLDGDAIGYPEPGAMVAADLRARAADIEGQLRGFEELLLLLPALLADWQLGQGSPGTSSVEVELFHGPSAVTDLWHHLLGRHPLRRTDAVAPHTLPLAVPDPAMQAVWHAHIQAPGNRARIVAHTSDAAATALAPRIASETAAGLQLRMHPRLPGFFWVADGEVVALPLQWGEDWPTSLVAIRSAPIAGLAQSYFDRLWDEAVPIRTGRRDWEPLLRLMAGGSSLAAAARAVGMSERTSRRRIDEAMAHYGVTSVFALGTAWGADPSAGH